MSSETIIPLSLDEKPTEVKPAEAPHEPPRFFERQIVWVDGILFRIEKVGRRGIIAIPVIPYTYANNVIQIAPPLEKK
ncbi:MAG: hypothetical protein P4L50_03150 [Anaerolineaceae bacterium]|nr:hypothetical protein [Anaerolineaceae bacterium]